MERLLEVSKVVNAIQPASRTAGTVNGGAQDTDGYAEASFILTTGAIDAGITNVSIAIEESADGSTGWTAITGAATVALDGDGDGAIPTVAVRLSGRAAGTRKRYLRPVLTVAGTGNAVAGVVLVLNNASNAPVTNTPASVLK
ncbi:MAG: hypothetical protein HRF50_15075 [Phycisphaerae bacterium]|jgi:hypothetical protein